MKRDIEIRCLSEFLAALKSFVPESDLSYFDLWFRGERDHASWTLSPKVFRKKLKNLSEQPNYERDITNRFRVLAHSRHSVDLAYDNYGRALSLMQHYGLPTRLLDWSTSSLVAIFFAVGRYNYDSDLEPVDAGVWVLDPYELNRIQFNDPTTPSIEAESVRDYLRPAFNTWVKGKNQLFEPGQIKKPEKYFKAVMGVEFDARIFVQQGAFTIHTTSDGLEKQEKLKNCLGKIIIPATHVRKIANELMLAGLRNSTLYPDLNHLSSDLDLRYPSD